MAKAPAFSSIPVPQNNVDALYNTCMALKQTVEKLIRTSPVTVSQLGAPASPVEGDIWIQPATGRMSYWNGKQWVMMSGGVGGFGALAVDGQAIPTTAAKVTLVNPPAFNRGEFYNSDTQRFTPPVGMIQFNAQLQAVLNVGNAVVNVHIYKNGVPLGLSSASGNNGQLVTATLSFVTYQASIGDYYELFMSATSGGMTVVGAGSGFGAWGVGTSEI